MAERTPICRTLFVTNKGEAIHFYIRPCPEKSKLRQLIESRGGILETQPGSNSYRLVQPNDRPPESSKNNISTNFIYDCVSENKLLPMERFLIRTQSQSDLEDGLDLENSDEEVSFRTNARTTKSKPEPYTHAEDQKIVDYLIRRKEYASVKARMMWQEMEVAMRREKVMKNRTWQSLKERFLKRILPNLSSLEVTDQEFKNLKKGAGSWCRADEIQMQKLKKKKRYRQVVIASDSDTSNVGESGNAGASARDGGRSPEVILTGTAATEELSGQASAKQSTPDASTSTKTRTIVPVGIVIPDSRQSDNERSPVQPTRNRTTASGTNLTGSSPTRKRVTFSRGSPSSMQQMTMTSTVQQHTVATSPALNEEWSYRKTVSPTKSTPTRSLRTVHDKSSVSKGLSMNVHITTPGRGKSATVSKPTQSSTPSKEPNVEMIDIATTVSSASSRRTAASGQLQLHKLKNRLGEKLHSPEKLRLSSTSTSDIEEKPNIQPVTNCSEFIILDKEIRIVDKLRLNLVDKMNARTNTESQSSLEKQESLSLLDDRTLLHESYLSQMRKTVAGKLKSSQKSSGSEESLETCSPERGNIEVSSSESNIEASSERGASSPESNKENDDIDSMDEYICEMAEGRTPTQKQGGTLEQFQATIRNKLSSSNLNTSEFSTEELDRTVTALPLLESICSTPSLTGSPKIPIPPSRDIQTRKRSASFRTESRKKVSRRINFSKNSQVEGGSVTQQTSLDNKSNQENRQVVSGGSSSSNSKRPIMSRGSSCSKANPPVVSGSSTNPPIASDSSCSNAKGLHICMDASGVSRKVIKSVQDLTEVENNLHVWGLRFITTKRGFVHLKEDECVISKKEWEVIMRGVKSSKEGLCQEELTQKVRWILDKPTSEVNDDDMVSLEHFKSDFVCNYNV